MRTLAALALLAPTVLLAQTEQRALSGSSVAIYDLVGQVHAAAGSGSDVVVDVNRLGPDAAKLRVETGAKGSRNTLRVIFPDTHVIYSRLGRHSTTTLDVEDDGTFGDKSHGHRVRITGDGSGLDAQADLKIAIPAGKTVAIHLAVGGVSIANVDGNLSVEAFGADVTSENTKGSLSLDTGSGETKVTNAVGDLDLDSGSGNVTLSGIKGAVLKIDSGSGDIRADAVTVDRADLDSGSGSVTIAGLNARAITLDSGSGEVDLGLTGDVDRLDIDSGSGSVTLRIPETLGAQLDVDAGSGGVRTDVPIQVTRYESDRLVGRIGDGKGTIKIESGSGEVRIVKG
jgi:lia operon protein LiaG